MTEMPQTAHPVDERPLLGLRAQDGDDSGILLASISAVLLNLFLNGANRDDAGVIAAAQQAEAH